MELDKKFKKKCKNSVKKKPKSTRKKVKFDTPKAGDAKYLKSEKKLQSNIDDINKSNEISKILNNMKNSLKLVNDLKKKNLVRTRKIKRNKSCSALTESKTKKTRNDKMTKLSRVKMVDPLFKLIDFEAELKIEKIPKDDSNSIEINFEKSLSTKEVDNNQVEINNEVEKNTRNKITNLNSSNLNSSQMNSKTLRRNPSRRISQRGNNLDNKLTGEELQKNLIKISAKAKQIKKNNHNKQTNINLPLKSKESNQNKINSKVENETELTIATEISNILSHVPMDENFIKSTLEKDLNVSDKNINLTNLEFNQKCLNKIHIEQKENVKNIFDSIEKSKLIKENEQTIEKKDELIMEDLSSNINQIPEVKDEMEILCNLNFKNEKCDYLKNSSEFAIGNDEDKSNDLINNYKNFEQPKHIEHEIDTSATQKLENGKENLELSSEEFHKFETTNGLIDTELKMESKIEITDTNINKKSSTNILNNHINGANNIPINNNIKIKSTEENYHRKAKNSNEKKSFNLKLLSDIPNSLETESNLAENLREKKNFVISSVEKYFIFDDNFEEEISTCTVSNCDEENLLNINAKICGEIIHKTQEDFSINCYMCWDNENWKFKKFNDLKLFSAHLNSTHSSDEIHLQNQRGNSYSLDFVNENSCVMPQSMWFGIYNEMISFKCGFAKVNSDGFIHYSCLECKHDFKNFCTFTKHIIDRQNNKNGQQCNIATDTTKSNSAHLVPPYLFHTEKENYSSDVETQKYKSKLLECKQHDVLSENKININDLKNSNEAKDFEMDNIEEQLSSTDNMNSMKDNQISKLKTDLEKSNKKQYENVENSNITNNVIPDAYGYNNITSALLSIFDENDNDSVSSKLNKIISLGKIYRENKEKEKLFFEQNEKERSLIKEKLMNLDLKEVDNANKSILDLENKLSLNTCKYCNRQFKALTNFREHIRIHVGERIFLCNTCERGFSKRCNLEEHIKMFHKDSKIQNDDLDKLSENRKEIAKKTFATPNESNSKEKGYKCEYCQRFLTNRSSLEDHLRTHFGEKPQSCIECNLQFLRKSIYDSHLIEVHQSKNNDVSYELSSYDKENKPFTKTQKNNLVCDECPDSFASKVELLEHLVLNHNNSNFKCNYCEQVFSSSKKRSYHEKLHENGTKFQCNFCNKNLRNLFTLQMHEKSHKVELNIKCRVCDRCFASENTRNLHEQLHESTEKELKMQTVDVATILQMNNEQSPINTNASGQDSNGASNDATDRSSSQNTTTRNLTVKKIIKKIKRGKRDPNTPLDCRYCKKQFDSPHQLSYHERLHEIGKKFQCNLCDKIMATSYALDLHLTAHLKKNKLNNKINGSTILANQLAQNRKSNDTKSKIEIVSDVALAPNQTITILNSFFKRNIPSLTVTTTSVDKSFQKIGVDDIEKNLTAHVLRDTDPYYQLMADFSYQYQLYQNKKVSETEKILSNQNKSIDFLLKNQDGQNSIEKIQNNDEENININETIFSQDKVLSDFQTNNVLENQNREDVFQTKAGDSGKKKLKKNIPVDNAKNVTSAFIKCEYCNLKIDNNDKKVLNRHMRFHIAGDAHKCSFCKKCFASLYFLDRHLKNNHLEHNEKHKCNLCSSVYALKETLRRHHLRAHKNINSNIKNIRESINSNNKLEDEQSNETAFIENIWQDCPTIFEKNLSNETNDFVIPQVPQPKRKPKSKEIKLDHCDYCEKSFSSQNSLQVHIDRVHKKKVENFEDRYTFSCSYENCKKKFESITHLEKHIRLHESGYKCSICGKKTISQILLDHHMRSHGVATSFACKFCMSKFTMKLTKDIHEKKVHSKGSRNSLPNLIIKKYKMRKKKITYCCYNCKQSFSSLVLLKSHNMYKHPILECNVCPAIFSKRIDLEEHEKIHLKTLQCNLCEKTFENKHTLYKHRRQHETKFFKCNMCPSEFSFRDELNEHKKNHDESERPFKCVELGCDKGFVVETFLNTHLKKIHGYFLFNCDRCKKEFLNENLQIEHKKEHELSQSDKQFRCDQCFKDFSTLTILKIHQKLHQSSVVAAAADANTPNPQKTSKLKLYTCEQCDKRFSIVTYLNNHLKKVHQVKLFVCEHCKMEFRNQTDLLEHNKVHLTGKKFIRVEKTHLDRPFKCELCGNSYAILAYLNNHLNKAHGNEENPDDKIKNDQESKIKEDLFNLNGNDNMNSTQEYGSNLCNGSQQLTKIIQMHTNSKNDSSVKCDKCYLRFVSQKYLKDHSKMHSDPSDLSRLEMLESAFNPERSEKIPNPVIISSRNNNNINKLKEKQQKNKSKNRTITKVRKVKVKEKPQIKRYDEDSTSSVELIDVSEPPEVPDHNLSYTQITEALSSASSCLTAIQPVELIEGSTEEDQRMIAGELTPLRTLTTLTSLTNLTHLDSSEIFQHSANDNCILQANQQQQIHSQLQTTNTNSIELSSLEPSTISEATKLSLTLLEPSALCELTALTQPSAISVIPTNLNDILCPYDSLSSRIMQNEHSILTELTSSSRTKSFETNLITTQCNNSSVMLNTSSASSDYAVTNMDNSQITQQVKKPRISDTNMQLQTFSILDNSMISQTEQKMKNDMLAFSNFDSSRSYISSKIISNNNMTFADFCLSTNSLISDSPSLDPPTYSDSMPLSEVTSILELTSSSQPTSSSEATALSESAYNNSNSLNFAGKPKRISPNKNKIKNIIPNDSEIINLDGNFENSFEINEFKCTLCRRTYDCWSKFKKHNEYHTIRPYQCLICPLNFKTNEELLNHNKVHENTDKSFACKICNRVFISNSRLKTHTLTVHNEERYFKCEYCQKDFKTNSRLVDHVRSHTGEKPIKCHYCDEHFGRAAYRLKHERTLHPELLEIDTKHKEEKQKEKKFTLKQN